MKGSINYQFNVDFQSKSVLITNSHFFTNHKAYLFLLVKKREVPSEAIFLCKPSEAIQEHI